MGGVNTLEHRQSVILEDLVPVLAEAVVALDTSAAAAISGA